MMKNRIRGATLVLITLVLTGCAMTRLSKSQQSSKRVGMEKKEVVAVESEKQAGMTARKTEERQREQTTIVQTREMIPASETNVEIPIQSLLDLPDGAGYTSKDGQASVGVQKHGDNISVTGKCDSIARQCLYYEREVFRQRGKLDSLKQVLSSARVLDSQKEEFHEAGDNTIQDVKKKSPATWYKWLLAGCVAGLLLALPLNRLKNKVLTFIN